MYPTGFSFCFFPGYLAIYSLSSNNNRDPTSQRSPHLQIQHTLPLTTFSRDFITKFKFGRFNRPFFFSYISLNSVYLPTRILLDFPYFSSLAFLQFLSLCHRTTTTNIIPPNSTPRRSPSYLLLTLLLYFLFIFHILENVEENLPVTGTEKGGI